MKPPRRPSYSRLPVTEFRGRFLLLRLLRRFRQIDTEFRAIFFSRHHFTPVRHHARLFISTELHNAQLEFRYYATGRRIFAIDMLSTLSSSSAGVLSGFRQKKGHERKGRARCQLKLFRAHYATLHLRLKVIRCCMAQLAAGQLTGLLPFLRK